MSLWLLVEVLQSRLSTAHLECGELKQFRNLRCVFLFKHNKYLNFKWRASLVPAAAVIPAPLAYTIIVAVKRLVVGLNCKHNINIILFIVWQVLRYKSLRFWRSTLLWTYSLAQKILYTHLFDLRTVNNYYARIKFIFYAAHLMFMYYISTLWTNQSVSNMSFLNVHWMSYHGMLHF